MSSSSSTTSTPDKEFTNGNDSAYDRYTDCPKDAVEFEIKDGYTIIGESAFKDCVSLKNIKLPKSIKRINTNAFYNCSSLQKIDLPSSLTTLGDHAFFNCSSLQSIVLPSSLTTLGYQAFFNCTSLQKIDLPPSLTTLSDSAFESCSSLKEITGPPSLKRRFKYCEAVYIYRSYSVASPPDEVPTVEPKNYGIF